MPHFYKVNPCSTSRSRASSCQMWKSCAAGFSLVEALVAIVVLAIGVIGAAGLQLAAFRTAQQSAYQTSALQIASEMADAIRTINQHLKQAGSASPFSQVSYQSTGDGDLPMPPKLCYAARCDAEELAQFELYEWKSRVHAALPGGRLLICHDASPWDSGKKSLSWDCTGTSESTAPLVIKVGWQAKNPDGALVKDGDGKFPPSVAITVGLPAI